MSDDVFVEIESLAPGGDAVGRQRGAPGGRDNDGDRDETDGRVTFVPLAAPGERVQARIVRAQGRVAWAELVAIARPGPARVTPPCPLFGACGGCQWQHVSLEAQHAAKKVIVERALGITIGPVIAASRPFGYRDRAKLAVGAGGRVGFRARRSHDVIDVPTCPLFSARLSPALPVVRALGARLAAGAEIDAQAGAEGVCIDVAKVDGAGAAHARREWDRLQAGGVVGLSLAGKPTYGRAAVDVAEPGSPVLSTSASGFAQVGHESNAALVAAVLEAVGGDEAPDRPRALGQVVELYAGSGNFTRHLVARATSVRAYEADPAAVERGRSTVPGATWAIGPGTKGLAAQPIDMVLLDPPREGADAANLAVAQKARSRIVYVSCDSQTLARDARRIAAGGFRLSGAVALDLMPHTHHVEVVATFDRV